MSSDLVITVGAIGFIFLLFNVIFLAVIFSAQKDAAVAAKWPTTMGTILISTLESRRTNSGRHAQYPVVLYSYQAGGRSYQGNRIAPGPEVGGTGAPKRLVGYQVGSQVTVFYNPNDPSDAVLETKVSSLFWLWFALILVDLVLGIVALFNIMM
jgi:hypothetical protein